MLSLSEPEAWSDGEFGLVTVREHRRWMMRGVLRRHRLAQGVLNSEISFFEGKDFG